MDKAAGLDFQFEEAHSAYVTSGKTSPKAILTMLLIGGVISAIGGVLMSKMIIYIEEIKGSGLHKDLQTVIDILKFIPFVLLGAGIAIGVNAGGTIGHNRNASAGKAISIACGMLAAYFFLSSYPWAPSFSHIIMAALIVMNAFFRTLGAVTQILLTAKPIAVLWTQYTST